MPLPLRRRALLLGTGAALVAAASARAQRPALPLIGFLHASAPTGPYRSLGLTVPQLLLAQADEVI